MGQLFTRISTGWSDQQTSTIITENNFVSIKPIITKRKCIDQNNFSKRRKIDENNRLSYSPRISKITKSSNFLNTSIISQSLSPMTLFKCQLCYHCFSNKDDYLDHMIICAIQRQASIKIVRATKNYSIQL